MATFRQATQTTTVENFFYWSKKARKSGLYDVISKLDTSAMYNVHPILIQEIMGRSQPLKGVTYRDNLLSNLNSPWPMVLFFDIMTEDMGVPPTWEQYYRAMITTYKDKFFDYALSSKLTQKKQIRALKWRMGKAYISWMKELYILTTLRQEGYNVHRHTFADIEGRVDIFRLNPVKGVSITVESVWDKRKKVPSIPYKKIYLPLSDNLNVPEHLMEEIRQWLM
jgi:hypothetical protein